MRRTVANFYTVDIMYDNKVVLLWQNKNIAQWDSDSHIEAVAKASVIIQTIELCLKHGFKS